MSRPDGPKRQQQRVRLSTVARVGRPDWANRAGGSILRTRRFGLRRRRRRKDCIAGLWRRAAGNVADDALVEEDATAANCGRSAHILPFLMEVPAKQSTQPRLRGGAGSVKLIQSPGTGSSTTTGWNSTPSAIV